MNPEDFWKPNESVVETYDELFEIIHKVFQKWSTKKRMFAWRGQIDSSWPLYSSLYRRLNWTLTKTECPDERDLYRREGQVLAELHRWGLHMSTDVGRLSILNQLAALQHYGAPTRLIDVTFNPWIGAWFAVEEKRDNGKVIHEDKDARLFAIDVTDRLINENDEYRIWEDELKRTWPNPEKSSDDKNPYYLWCSKVMAWKPPRFDSRIAAQNGGFVLGGVPLTKSPHGQNQWPKGGSSGMWKIDEVRTATSIALRPHKLEPIRGGVSQNAVYTIRIKAKAKKQIRNILERLYGYNHSTIYPDFTGFASNGTPDLKTAP